MLASSHPHLQPAGIALLAAALVVYGLVAVALPTHQCPRCHGKRVRFIKVSGKTRTRPCRRCSGTGRTPRLGARTIHRLIWSVRSERNK